MKLFPYFHASLLTLASFTSFDSNRGTGEFEIFLLAVAWPTKLQLYLLNLPEKVVTQKGFNLTFMTTTLVVTIKRSSKSHWKKNQRVHGWISLLMIIFSRSVEICNTLASSILFVGSPSPSCPFFNICWWKIIDAIVDLVGILIHWLFALAVLRCGCSVKSAWDGGASRVIIMTTHLKYGTAAKIPIVVTGVSQNSDSPSAYCSHQPAWVLLDYWTFQLTSLSASRGRNGPDATVMVDA